MTFPEEDLPLNAPLLLTLSANAIAENPFVLGLPSTSYESKYGHEEMGEEKEEEEEGKECEKSMVPLEASRALFDAMRRAWTGPVETRQGDCRQVLEHFTDGKRFPLDRLDLSGAVLNDSLLARLLAAHAHRLLLLDLTHCTGLNGRQFQILVENDDLQMQRLKSIAFSSYELFGQSRESGLLKKGVSTGTLPMVSEDDLDFSLHPDTPILMDTSHFKTLTYSSSSSECECDLSAEMPLLTGRCVNVVSARLLGSNYKEDFMEPNAFLLSVLSPLKRLCQLDLSYWQRMDDFRCLRPLAKTLIVLVLFDVPDLHNALNTICELASLKHLDVSQSQKESGIYPQPVSSLHKLCISLQHLEHLDISSTNLASAPSSADRPFRGLGNVPSDIFGLRFLRNRLRFLGLFNCDNASHFAEIPADQITGDANEEQIVLALRHYTERRQLLQMALSESYQLYRFGDSNSQSRHREALELVLAAMGGHLDDSSVQIAGSASLFYIIRCVDLNRLTKRHVVITLLDGMEAHMDEHVIVRNCCLSLCQFDIPQEILFDYDRVARLLVPVLQHHSGDHLTQRIVVFLLNSMACHVEGEQKIRVGNIGAIESMLEQIRRKHQANVCDDVMEVGWSFLWNITDETPVNCERFLRGEGLQLFYQCYQSFPEKQNLQRNMMGLMGNIAEVGHLRVHLMKEEYIAIFCGLLENLNDGIEISYNSAGVLAHMVSDGQEAWTAAAMPNVDRQRVMDGIVTATEGWSLKARRFINYRSFRPILRLLPLFHSSASQHWAVWALANLTSTDGQKYCAYIENEGGMPLLEALSTHHHSTEQIKRLANIVLSNVEKWRRRKETICDSSSDEMAAENEEDN